MQLYQVSSSSFLNLLHTRNSIWPVIIYVFFRRKTVWSCDGDSVVVLSSSFRVPILLLTKNPGLSRTPMRNFPGPLRSPRMLKYKKIEARGLKGWEREWGSWEGNSKPPPNQLGSGGSGAEPQKIWNLVQLEMSKFTAEMP